MKKKTCSVCKREKSLGSFYTYGRYANGEIKYRPNCNICYIAGEEAK